MTRSRWRRRTRATFLAVPLLIGWMTGACASGAVDTAAWCQDLVDLMEQFRDGHGDAASEAEVFEQASRLWERGPEPVRDAWRGIERSGGMDTLTAQEQLVGPIRDSCGETLPSWAFEPLPDMPAAAPTSSAPELVSHWRALSVEEVPADAIHNLLVDPPADATSLCDAMGLDMEFVVSATGLAPDELVRSPILDPGFAACNWVLEVEPGAVGDGDGSGRIAVLGVRVEEDLPVVTEFQGVLPSSVTTTPAGTRVQRHDETRDDEDPHTFVTLWDLQRDALISVVTSTTLEDPQATAARAIDHVLDHLSLTPP